MSWVELGPDELTRCARLGVAGPQGIPYLLRAVLQGLQPGRVFADDRAVPRAAFVVNRVGFCALLGQETDAFHDAVVDAMTREGALGVRYLLWYAPPPSWASALDGLVPAPVRRRERVRFEFDRALASYVDNVETVPEGFALRPLTGEWMSRVGPLKLDIASRFWASAEQFRAEGVGVGLFHGDVVASVCYAACVADRHAEVDVATAEAYRARGLASVAGREFVRLCLRRGIVPAWDAFAENQGSVKLAESLGFRPRATYPFYTFALPLSGSLAGPTGPIGPARASEAGGRRVP
jgi:RimJ/RimL family protein N-acetyltransferase